MACELFLFLFPFKVHIALVIFKTYSEIFDFFSIPNLSASTKTCTLQRSFSLGFEFFSVFFMNFHDIFYVDVYLSGFLGLLSCIGLMSWMIYYDENYKQMGSFGEDISFNYPKG